MAILAKRVGKLLIFYIRYIVGCFPHLCRHLYQTITKSNEILRRSTMACHHAASKSVYYFNITSTASSLSNTDSGWTPTLCCLTAQKSLIRRKTGKPLVVRNGTLKGLYFNNGMCKSHSMASQTNVCCQRCHTSTTVSQAL